MTMEQLDPRLVEIEILSEADCAFVAGGTSYQYRKANPSGPKDRQRDEALLGLMFAGAIVGGTHYKTGSNVSVFPDPKPPNPAYGIDAAAVEGIEAFASSKDILNLRITQIGRLRLYRLRDEILQRDRIRDEFNVLWAHRHWLPDIEVLLRFRDRQQPFSLVLLDVDKLKSLNSELGNPGADKVLTGIFETLWDVVRPHEAYRLGGDEAGAILPSVTQVDAGKIAEEIRRTVEARPWPGLQIQTRPTVSIGVGTYTKESPIDAEAFYVAVDRVRARAKDYRNRVETAVVPEAIYA
jgi:diguanylate cyclase (GGDEF)-like protein